VPLILICAEGYRSSLAAATLHDLGIGDATDVIDGFDGWIAAELPIEQSLERQQADRQPASCDLPEWLVPPTDAV
jgi:hypothetical protein